MKMEGRLDDCSVALILSDLKPAGSLKTARSAPLLSSCAIAVYSDVIIFRCPLMVGMGYMDCSFLYQLISIIFLTALVSE